jgi:hypothetical protein
MGQIADDMISGVCCECCGVYLECDECEEIGVPAYCCLECAKDRGRGREAVCNHNQ